MSHARWIAAPLAAWAATVACPMAAAAEVSPWAASANVSLVSDYRFRGISQSYELPAVQGGFDLGHTAGYYVGTWGSSVSGNQFIGGNSMEWDLYGGYKLELAKNLPLDFGVLYYAYPGAKAQLRGIPPDAKRYDTVELYGALTYGGLTGKLSYAVGDFFALNNSSGSWYAEANYNYAVSRAVNLVAHVGHQEVSNNRNLNYSDLKLGGTVDAVGLTWGGALITTNAKTQYYTTTSVSDGSTKVISRATIVVSVGKSF